MRLPEWTFLDLHYIIQTSLNVTNKGKHLSLLKYEINYCRMMQAHDRPLQLNR